jgi:hypothetical protein
VLLRGQVLGVHPGEVFLAEHSSLRGLGGLCFGGHALLDEALQTFAKHRRRLEELYRDAVCSL